eukprot:2579227-Amphidinium_carterae.1
MDAEHSARGLRYKVAGHPAAKGEGDGTNEMDSLWGSWPVNRQSAYWSRSNSSGCPPSYPLDLFPKDLHLLGTYTCTVHYYIAHGRSGGPERLNHGCCARLEKHKIAPYRTVDWSDDHEHTRQWRHSITQSNTRGPLQHHVLGALWRPTCIGFGLESVAVAKDACGSDYISFQSQAQHCNPSLYVVCYGH